MYTLNTHVETHGFVLYTLAIYSTLNIISSVFILSVQEIVRSEGQETWQNPFVFAVNKKPLWVFNFTWCYGLVFKLGDKTKYVYFEINWETERIVYEKVCLGQKKIPVVCCKPSVRILVKYVYMRTMAAHTSCVNLVDWNCSESCNISLLFIGVWKMNMYTKSNVYVSFNVMWLYPGLTLECLHMFLFTQDNWSMEDILCCYRACQVAIVSQLLHTSPLTESQLRTHTAD